MSFIEELHRRGMIHNMMPGIEEQLKKEMTVAYLGIDPTADSLHIGHLVGVMMLKHFQLSGHKPIALIGGATGMIGDPSGKSSERNLLDIETLRHNQEAIKKQLSRFLDFNSKSENAAEMVNNYDWMSRFCFLDFIRDFGKHISINYMMAKDSVKKRIEGTDDENAEGMSFTEFSYQLVQGYDFLHLYKEKNCKLQLGGSDQWGNITTGTELIRRIDGGKAYALTCPLITKSDGGKFGKTEKGNIWLDAERTSSYEFYQFWLNTSDEDAQKYLKIFTILNINEIENLISKHAETPHQRLLQTTLAKELTTAVHGEAEYRNAVEASKILFGNGSKEMLEKLSEKTFLDVFAGVPTFEIEKSVIAENLVLSDLLAEKTKAFPSKSEMRRTVKDGGLSMNQQKVTDSEIVVTKENLIKGKYLVFRRGKKNYFIVKVAI
jgi:tyrosyl-tRNA synthetase